MARRRPMHRALPHCAINIALCAGSLAAHAQPAPHHTPSTVLTLPGGARPVRTTAATVSDLRSIAMGPGAIGITWTESRGPGVAPELWWAASIDGGRTAHAFPTDPKIRLKFAGFDPRRGEPMIPQPLRQSAAGRVFMVQLALPPTQWMRDQLALAGATIRHAVPPLVYVVEMPPQTRQAVAALPFVRWVGPYHPAYRLDAPVLVTVMRDHSDRHRGRRPGGGGGHAAQRYSIEALQRGPQAQQKIADRIRAARGVVHLTTPEGFRLEATLTPAQVLAIAQMDEVNRIEPWQGPGSSDMATVRQTGGAVPILSNAGFTGQGVRGEVFDTGILPTHIDFQSPPIQFHNRNGPFNVWDHGTSTYGIIFGDGIGRAAATGMLPDAEQGIFADWTQVTMFGGFKTRHQHTAELVDPAGPWRAVFQCATFGSSPNYAYSTITAEVDDYLWLHDLLSCQSMGNTASQLSRPQAWAKNIIGVGGVQHRNTLAREDDRAGNASFGPAPDGRIKPDLAHFDDGIETTTSTSDQGYTTNFVGTSAATAITAGHAGLVFQMWHAGVWAGYGQNATVFDSRPRMSTAKALLINHAYRYDFAAGSTNNRTITRARQGWGVADVGRMYTQRDSTFIINETVPLAPLETRTYTLRVLPDTPELRVTMVYTDPRGNPNAEYARINDLTLRVTPPPPAEVSFWGNGGLTASNVSSASGIPDTRDPTENVLIVNPAPGLWTIEVMGVEVLEDASSAPGINAGFSLVASGVRRPCILEQAVPHGPWSVPDPAMYLEWYAAGSDRADVAPPYGVVDIHDLFDALGQFARGCR